MYLNDDEDTEAQARMEHLTMESTKLLGCVKALNPSLYKAVCHGRLDNDQSSAAQQLDQSWFTSLPVCNSNYLGWGTMQDRFSPLSSYYTLCNGIDRIHGLTHVMLLSLQ